MDFGLLILVLGICFPDWTTAATASNVTYDLFNGTLESVSVFDSRVVNLSNLSIKYLANNCFDALEEVEELDLSFNNLVDLPRGVFAKMKNLKKLSLSRNQIGSTFNTTSLGLTNLDYLDLSRTNIESLEEGQLFGVSKSGKVIVKGSGLQWITTNVFKNPRWWIPVPAEVPFWMDPNFDIEAWGATLPPLDDYFGLCVMRSGGILTSITMYEEDDPSVDCTSRTAFVLIKNHKYMDMKLNNQGISNIKDGIFDEMEFTLDKLELQSNDFKSTAFVRQLPKQIRILKLDYNPISEVPLASFYDMKNLEELSICHTYITHIEPGTFRDQKNLVSLVLINNEISELEPGFFLGLDSLEIINLDRNKFTKVPSNMFTGWNQPLRISFISLDRNRISTIEDGAFSHMNIRALSLRENPFRDDGIREGSFNGSIISKLELLKTELTRFNGEWFRGISGLEQIFLSSMEVSKIEKGFAKYMKNVTAFGLEYTPVKILQNGALFGLPTENGGRVYVRTPVLEVIEGGVFDDL